MWGYLNTPVALMEVMMSDQPHVMYHPPKPTLEQIENRAIIEEDLRRKIQQGGLRAIKKLNLNFKAGTGSARDAVLGVKQK